MDSLRNLVSYYNNGENDIFRYIICKMFCNHRVFFDGSIYDMAENCSSSPATISRLAQSMGYRSYSDLKNSVYDKYRSYKYENRVLINEESINEDGILNEYYSAMYKVLSEVQNSADRNTLSDIANELRHAQKVRFFTENINFTEQRLQLNLLKKRCDAKVIQRAAKGLPEIDDMSAGDIAIVVSRDMSDTMGIMVSLLLGKEKGAKTVLITNSLNAQFKSMADYFVGFNGSGGGIDDFGIYAIIDQINLIYRKRYIDRDGPGDF